MTTAPALLGAGAAEFGPTTMGLGLAGLGLGAVSWSRGHPKAFDRYAAPALRAFRRRWLR